MTQPDDPGIHPDPLDTWEAFSRACDDGLYIPDFDVCEAPAPTRKPTGRDWLAWAALALLIAGVAAIEIWSLSALINVMRGLVQ